MCKRTDEQIGKIIRGALSEITDLMAEETNNKLLGLPRYKKDVLSGVGAQLFRDGPTFDYALSVIHAKGVVNPLGTNTIAFFRDEETCDLAVELFNYKYRFDMNLR